MQSVSVTIRQACSLFIVFTILLGGVVPAVFTLLSHLLFSDAASGSLITHDNRLVGSTLIGQEFTEPRYFWGRLSATHPSYNAAASAASNLSMLNPVLISRANERLEMLKGQGRVPLSLITASASGLDPHIDVPGAHYQIQRVAKLRAMKPEAVKALIEEATEPPLLGFIGEPRVNVLSLNLLLDAANER